MDDKKRLDQIFTMQVSFSYQSAKGLILTQASWSKYRVVHHSSSKGRLLQRDPFLMPVILP
ncbi:MAG TPA: hypothetical protein VN494_02565, partial [Patescibacteria group bacterium]|nr:hypothetical protein [Patescibacteria group bacterium]